MKRIDTPNKVTDLFGPGKHGWRPGDRVAGVSATELSAAFLNALQEEIASLIEWAGFDLNGASNTQLRQALLAKFATQASLEDYATQIGLQKNAYSVANAGGTPDAIACSYSPGIVALTNGMTLYVRTGSANATTAPTFTPNSEAIEAKAIVKGNGLALAAGDIAGGGHWIELQYDLALDKWVLLNPATGVSVQTGVQVPVRQTVLSGPVDANGFASFGGAVGSTTVTASGTLTVAAANGFGPTGAVDKVFQIANPSWPGLSTNGTMYLYVDWNNGTPTTGSTTLQPIYQWGGTFSAVNGQHTFNIQQMQMQVGNGSSASQINRVFVGEVTVAGGVVTAITWYALMAEYRSAATAIPANATKTVFSHNIGTDVGLQPRAWLKCGTAELGYSVGDYATFGANNSTNPGVPIDSTSMDGRNAVSVMTGISGTQVNNKSTGNTALITPANWTYVMNVKRGW